MKMKSNSLPPKHSSETAGDRLASEINLHSCKESVVTEIVAGESLIKERAAARFNDLVGSTDVVAGEPLLLLPRRFRQNLAWMELNKIWRTNTKEAPSRKGD
ncbi:hypothetical protein Fmac_000025 [Flemingia macrophylla]|uniref:Ribosomal protein S1 n=1 Tax=Flemingia macrophylla TaxID=520843 RepID=A0ABD1NFV8_9FABA